MDNNVNNDAVAARRRALAEALRTEREALAQDTAFLYAKFVARDAKKNDLLKVIHKSSDLYQTILRFDNQWFTGHTSYDFTDVKLLSYSQFTSTDFACEISFQPKYYLGKTEIDGAPFHCRLMFVQVDDEWKVVALTNIIEESETPDTSTDASNTTTTTTKTETTATAN